MNADKRTAEEMVVEISGTRAELEVIAAIVMNELNWEDMEQQYDLTKGFLAELYDALMEDAE